VVVDQRVERVQVQVKVPEQRLAVEE
jgi:hypothetical protein